MAKCTLHTDRAAAPLHGIYVCLCDKIPEFLAYYNDQMISANNTRAVVMEALDVFKRDQAAQDSRAIAPAPQAPAEQATSTVCAYCGAADAEHVIDLNIPGIDAPGAMKYPECEDCRMSRAFDYRSTVEQAPAAPAAPATQSAQKAHEPRESDSPAIAQARADYAAAFDQSARYRDMADALRGPTHADQRRALIQQADREYGIALELREKLDALIVAEQAAPAEALAAIESTALFCAICGDEFSAYETGTSTCPPCTAALIAEFADEERRAGIDADYPQEDMPMFTMDARNRVAAIQDQIVASPKELRMLMDAMKTAARTRDQRYTERQQSKANLDELEAKLIAGIAAEVDPEKGKPVYTNDAARKAELAARLIGYPTITRAAAQDESDYRYACTDYDMAEQELKTARALLTYTTAQIQLMSEIYRADTTSAESIPF